MLDRETVERLLQNNLDAKLNSELSKYGYQLDAAHKLFRFITSIFERTPPWNSLISSSYDEHGSLKVSAIFYSSNSFI